MDLHCYRGLISVTILNVWNGFRINQKPGKGRAYDKNVQKLIYD